MNILTQTLLRSVTILLGNSTHTYQPPTFIIFIIIFVSTKDIKTSILITLLFVLLFKFILDENSKFCVVKKENKKTISKETVNKAYQILKKYKEENNIEDKS